jgi:hypothetical protein
MAEEVVFRISNNLKYRNEGLGVMDGVEGFITELMHAFERSELGSVSFTYDARTRGRAGWARYLVGDDPPKRWVYK